MLALIATFLLLALLLRSIYEYLIRDRDIPPGPTRLPLIGNLHQAPTGKQLPWHTYASWAQRYGPIFSIQMGTETLIMLANESVVHDLLNKRGKNYSHRPRFVMVGECMTKGLYLMLRNYDEDFKRHQRMEAPVLTPHVSEMYAPLQDLESKKLLYDPGKDSGSFVQHFQRFSLSFIFSLTYGFRVPSIDHPDLAEMRAIADNLLEASTFGRWIVDTLPFLNRLPSALAPWKVVAEKFHKRESTFYLDHMKHGMNTASWNWTKDFVQSNEGKGMDTLEMAYDLGILSIGGWETTVGVLRVFVLAAAVHPDLFKSARDQLDGVAGTDRLPTLGDRPSLPLVEACMKEVFRWRKILPCAFPRRNKTEDWYMGYRIPAKCIIIPLQWCMNLDENNFSNPNKFDPTHFTGPKSTGLEYHAFGYGRRICPGRHVAENSVFLAIARMLWAHEIRPADGWIYDDNNWSTQFFTTPSDVKVTFNARNSVHATLVEREWANAEIDIDKVSNGIQQQRKEL